MSVFTSFESRYLKNLDQRLEEDIKRLERIMGNGVMLQGSADATALQYAKAVGEVCGLKLALKHMSQIHADMTGRAADKKEAKD